MSWEAFHLALEWLLQNPSHDQFEPRYHLAPINRASLRLCFESEQRRWQSAGTRWEPAAERQVFMATCCEYWARVCVTPTWISLRPQPSMQLLPRWARPPNSI